MNKKTSIIIISLIILILIILIIILSGILIYTISTPSTTQTQPTKTTTKIKLPCEKKEAYYVKTWGGSNYYLSTNLEEAIKMAGNRLIVTKKRCKH